MKIDWAKTWNDVGNNLWNMYQFQVQKKQADDRLNMAKDELEMRKGMHDIELRKVKMLLDQLEKGNVSYADKISKATTPGTPGKPGTPPSVESVPNAEPYEMPTEDPYGFLAMLGLGKGETPANVSAQPPEGGEAPGLDLTSEHYYNPGEPAVPATPPKFDIQALASQFTQNELPPNALLNLLSQADNSKWAPIPGSEGTLYRQNQRGGGLPEVYTPPGVTMKQKNPNKYQMYKNAMPDASDDEILRKINEDTANIEEKKQTAITNRAEATKIMVKLPEMQTAARGAAMNIPQLDKLTELVNTAGVTGKSGQLKSWLAQYANEFAPEDWQKANYFQMMARLLVAHNRLDLIGSGAVSNYEQQLMQIMGGGGGASKMAALEFLNYYKSQGLGKIRAYNDMVDGLTVVDPNAPAMWKKQDVPTLSNVPPGLQPKANDIWVETPDGQGITRGGVVIPYNPDGTVTINGRKQKVNEVRP